MKSLKVKDIQELVESNGSADIKYVKVHNNDFRFAVACGYLEHCHLVSDGESVVSAGFISLAKDFFLLHSMPSTSLGVGPDEKDESLLRNLFV